MLLMAGTREHLLAASPDDAVNAGEPQPISNHLRSGISKFNDDAGTSRVLSGVFTDGRNSTPDALMETLYPNQCASEAKLTRVCSSC
uniref:Uncharacterized protein n=1 Tax=Ulva partita TaxID=1605170 RepID=A0A1C9ZW92_9CHLO|nr:hypothetical protein [Ulva partita]